MVDISRLQVVIGADTRDAEAGFARVSSGIGTFATGAAAALTAAGVGIVGAGAAAVKSAADFEKTLSGVKAVSGATADEMKGLSGLSLQLGKDTAFSASEAASGIEELVKGGLTIPDIMNGAAKATLDLAAAGGVSLPDAATIAANALAQFNLKGADMAHVADLIAGAANASALDVGQFKFSLQAAGAVAATTGFKFDDLAQAIAIMGKAGITGSDAGTSLKTMMMSLQPTTDKQKALFRELGLETTNLQAGLDDLRKRGVQPMGNDWGALNNAFADWKGISRDHAKWTADNRKAYDEWAHSTGTLGSAFFDATGKVKSMSQVAQVLQTATKGMTEAQRLQTLQTLFGSDAIRAAAVFAKEGATGFDEMAASMGKVTAAAVGNEKLNNLSGDLQTLQGSVETLAITFGTAFLPVLRDATQWATNFVNGLIPWVEQVGPQVVASIQTFGQYLRAVGEDGDYLNDFLTDLPPAIQPVVQGIGFVVATLRDLVDAVVTGFRQGGVVGALTAWLGEAQEFGGLLLEQVGAWGQALVDWIAPRVPDALQALGAFATAVYDWITGTALPAIATKVGEWGTALVGWIAPRLPDALTALGTFATGVWTWITQTALPTLVTKLGEWGGALVGWIAPRIPDVLAALGDLATRLWGWITGTALPTIEKKLGEWGSAFVDWIGPRIDPLLTEAGKLATRLWTWITTTAAPAAAEKLKTWGSAFVEWVSPKIEPLITEVGKLLSRLGTWITDDAAPAIGEKLGEWRDQFVAWIGPATDKFLEEWPANLTRFLDWIEKDAAPAIYTTLASWVSAFTTWVGGENEEGTAAGGLFKTIGKIAEVVWTFITKTAEVLGPRLATWAGKFLGWVATDVVPFLAEKLGQMLTAIGDWLRDKAAPWALERLKDFGKAIVAGIVAGIVAAPTAIRDAIAGLLPVNISVPTVATPSAPSHANTPPQWLPPVNVGGGAVGFVNGQLLRDSGGPGMAGQSYLIGTGAQPELFVPSTPGHFFPAGGYGGGTVVVPVSIDGREIVRATARIDERQRRRGIR